MTALVHRKDFALRNGEILLRWIASGPAGHIEFYVPYTSEQGGSRGEIHLHRYSEDPESCGAWRNDCDLMDGARCFFMAWWGAAARDLWNHVSEGGTEKDVQDFLENAYAQQFNIAFPTLAISVAGMTA